MIKSYEKTLYFATALLGRVWVVHCRSIILVASKEQWYKLACISPATWCQESELSLIRMGVGSHWDEVGFGWHRSGPNKAESGLIKKLAKIRSNRGWTSSGWGRGLLKWSRVSSKRCGTSSGLGRVTSKPNRASSKCFRTSWEWLATVKQ